MPVFLSLPQKTIDTLSMVKLSPSSGTLLFKDDFESNQLKWVNGAIINTAQKVRSGIYALQLITQAGGTFDINVTCRHGGVSKAVLTSKLGEEAYFCLQKITTTEIAHLTFSFVIYNGTNALTYAIRWLPTAAATGKLQYRNSAAGYTDITSGTCNLQVDYWNRIKFVVDPVNAKYVKVEVNGQEWDLSTIACQSVASGLSPVLNFQIYNCGIDATQETVWVDDFQFTYNET